MQFPKFWSQLSEVGAGSMLSNGDITNNIGVNIIMEYFEKCKVMVPFSINICVGRQSTGIPRSGGDIIPQIDYL